VTAAETSPFEARTEVEVVSMMIIQGVLIVIRFIAIFYFILMSIQHSKYQGEKRDKFTYFTFLFLAIS
jgi:preprotein translocase subunit YajC